MQGVNAGEGGFENYRFGTHKKKESFTEFPWLFFVFVFLYSSLFRVYNLILRVNFNLPNP